MVCNSLACHKPLPSGSSQLESSHQRLGFRFEQVDNALLLTEVAEGLGADDAGLQVGDIILSVDDLKGDRAIASLQDRNNTGVNVLVQSKGTLTTREVWIPRGVGALDSQSVMSAWLVAAAKGDFDLAKHSLGQTEVSTGELTKGLRLVARNYPQQYRQWLDLLKETEPSDPKRVLLVMKGYQTQRDVQAMLDVYTRWRSVNPTTIWPVTETSQSGINTYANLELEQLYTQALWQNNQQAEAIAHVRNVLPWYSKTGLESMVGMAIDPTSDVVWSAKIPVAPDLSGDDVLGGSWQVGQKNWTVLAFWATWCGPCKKELPELNRWAAEHSDINVLGVNVNDDLDTEGVVRALDKMGLDSIRGVKDSRLARMFDVDAIPTLVLLDEQGVEHYRMIGYSPQTITELDARIQNPKQTKTVPLVYTRGVKAQWYPRVGLQDIYQDRQGVLWVLEQNKVWNTRSLEDWLTNSDVLSSTILSELEGASRLWVENNRMLTLHNNQRVIRMVERDQAKAETLWSVGQSIEDVKFTPNGMWLWGEQFASWLGTDQTRQWYFSAEQEGLVRTLQVQQDTRNQTIDFDGEVMEDCAMSTYNQPDIAIIFADRAHFVSPLAKQEMACPVHEGLQEAVQSKDGYGLGDGVVDLSVRHEGIWVHQNRHPKISSPKQQSSAKKIVDSMVLIGKTGHPLGTLDFTESARILDISHSSMTATANDGLWVLIPNHGLLHVQSSLDFP